MGFEKAVICKTNFFHASFLEVTFQQAGGALEAVPSGEKIQRNHGQFYPRGDRMKNRPMWTGRT